MERPHVLIRASQKGLRDVSTDYDALLLIGGHGRLDLRVSLGALPRALWIMDRFVKRFEQEGFQVEVQDWTTSVIVEGRRIPVRMRESINRFEKPHDEREHARHKYNYVANGALTFHILNDWGSTKKYSDATRSRLEEKLESVVAGLLEERERIRRAEEEKRAREVMHQYEARAETESERRRSEMQKRIQDLMVDVDAWHQSKRIRAYLAAFQETAEEWSVQIDAKSDIGKWLTWARQYANSLDPLGPDVES